MKVSLRSLSCVPCLALLLAVAPAAHAQYSVSGEVWEGGTTGDVPVLGSSVYSSTATAVFTVTNTLPGDLFSFNSNGSSGASTYYTLSAFLESGGDSLSYISGSSAAGDSIDNDLFDFTGTTDLSNNTVYTFEHDDGMILYLGGTEVVDVPGPTSAANTTLCVGTPTGSPTCNYSVANPNGASESFTLLYAEVDGAPAVLETSLPLTGPPPSVTPEPSSIMMLGTGLLAAAGMVRRRIVA